MPTHLARSRAPFSASAAFRLGFRPFRCPARSRQLLTVSATRATERSERTASAVSTAERTVHPSNPPGSRPLPPLYISKHGLEVLEDPVYNYGAAHSAEERRKLKLGSYLPSAVHDLRTQVDRAYKQLQQRQEIAELGDAEEQASLMQYTFLRSLKDQNQVLFYALLQESLKETLKIIYTPVVGDSIINFSRLFRRPDGIFLSYPSYAEEVQSRGRDAGRQYIRNALTHYGELGPNDVDLLVATDGEGILGIGDWGVGGINICIGKSSIYTLGAGIDPNRTLSIALDVGTNNMQLREDPLYLGWSHDRITGEEYDNFVDDYVHVAASIFPHSLLHFEDFGNANALRLLNRYKDQVACFNDDVQGTGAVALAAVMSVCKVKNEYLNDQTYVVFGAGTAGLGITNRIRDALCTREGMTKEEANKRFYLIDREGLLTKSMQGLREGQAEFARDESEVSSWSKSVDTEGFSLLDVVKNAKPTILIGVSGQHGTFNEQVVKEMCKHCKRPAIFPLSNPSRLSEGVPAQISEWSNGKALMATGSPFDPVDILGKERKYIVAESNNAMFYPALGLGVVVAKANRVSDALIVAGVEALASLSPALKDPEDALLPDLHDVRNISMKVAAAVVRAAQQEGTAQAKGLPETLEGLEEYIRDRAWEPLYRELRPKS
ncbi:hypothetical protein K437DRAFT_255954 [Tilletiaria anomala UBC 951]|uniref:Malic enzyme n=1 Tax=Tilletiaria anomala (strain ATCC 24038 / CBS 436.72 / UBC 951) TaxID=1037660 RepID=A0A066W3M9_TILAU|nr:uncharacterized protein K437DRAFT_255954 [Tilletiaria anomala UBC 951]KDN47163.1 hypothetical protein K437DRAFT_255954 [Tilletiaria anomala UBC 951]